MATKYITENNIKDIDLSNIQVGMIIKNYKEMCKLLGEEEKQTKTKKTQLANWGRYMSFHKDGQKIIIDKIYDKPLDLELNGLRSSLFVSNAEVVLMDLLDTEIKDPETKNYITITKSRLFQALRFVDGEFLYYNRNQDKFKDEMEQFDIHFTKEQIQSSFNVCSSKAYSILDTVLKSLQRRKIIRVENIYMVNKNDGNGYQEEEVLTGVKNGEKYVRRPDLEIIEKVQKDALECMVFDKLIKKPDLYQVVKTCQFPEFSKRVKEYLEAETGWVGCFRVLKITPIKTKYWDKDGEELVQKVERCKDKLRENFYNRVKERNAKILYDAEEDRAMVDMIINYILHNPIMSPYELQDLYQKTIDEITRRNEAIIKERTETMRRFDELFKGCFNVVDEFGECSDNDWDELYGDTDFVVSLG